MLKPLPCSVERACRPRAISSSSERAAGDQDAELIAAHPVGRPWPLDGGHQRRRRAAQQHIAGAVAEGVVVALEAVEIEHHERRGWPRPARWIASSRSSINRRRLPSPVERVGRSPRASGACSMRTFSL